MGWDVQVSESFVIQNAYIKTETVSTFKLTIQKEICGFPS